MPYPIFAFIALLRWNLFASVLNRATFQIDTLEITHGELPRRQLRLVQAWAELHKDELQADWTLAMNGEEPRAIQPLQ